MKITQKMTRREFIASAGGTVVSIGLPGVFVKLMDSDNRAVAAQLRPDGRPRIPPGQHAVKALPNMGTQQEKIDLSEWHLKITGEVEKPMTLNISDLTALEQIDLTCDVHCVTGWTLLDSRWRGILMKTILDLVKVKNTAGFIIFEASGDYTSSIPLADSLKDNVILAHGFYDQKLPQAHGAPLRALVPDRYFYKSVKWLKGIKLSDVDEPGYYESAGFSNSADPWKEERFD
ncbi:MAG: molybdopterin-dependent oxidoreductase [Desulfobacterales bacterium]|jgi:DMSO/TMAO reductase YedYZ molybdopterin-dependent catalytic subunit